MDRGGTFTDCILHDAQGHVLKVLKVPSGPQAIEIGLRQLLDLSPDDPFPRGSLRIGTTVATNAFLERQGVKTALVTSTGLADILEIGDQTRPDLFALRIEKERPLADGVFEIPMRVDARGHVLASATDLEIESLLRSIRADGYRALAIALPFAHRHPQHEQRIAELAARVGFDEVVASNEVSSREGLLARTQTAVLDACLQPLLNADLARLRAAMPEVHITVMRSSGALAELSWLRAKDSILSGPAGGAVAVAALARSHQLRQAIGFDMGGTSTDVLRFAGDTSLVFERVVAGQRVLAPSVEIHTVAAGGGSLCALAGTRLEVGPRSAGAIPGPLCYGHPSATEVALTDVNLLLGRIEADNFAFPLDRARAERAMQVLVDQLGEQGTLGTREALAEGMFRVANQTMADAIRRITIAQGHDVREHALIAYGGAAGQHACAVADELGIRKVLLPPMGGVLSAWGISQAMPGWSGEAQWVAALDDLGLDDRALDGLLDRFTDLATKGLSSTRAADRASATFAVSMRYAGTLHEIEVEIGRVRLQRSTVAPAELFHDLRPQVSMALAHLEAAAPRRDAVARQLREQFEDGHRKTLGWRRDSHPIEISIARLRLVFAVADGVDENPTPRQGREEDHRPLRRIAGDVQASRVAPPASFDATATHRLYCDGRWLEGVSTLRRDELSVGQRVRGPALIRDGTTTIIIDPAWEAVVANDRGLLCEPTQTRAQRSIDPALVDPVLLTVLAHRFMAIAEQMGAELQRTAMSANIRERRDFSCAVFDRGGGLVANAPHIPVHLGAMSASVRAVLAKFPNCAPGDAFLTNDPSEGGSHLPDITVVTPVFDDDDRLRYWVASRGHHADVGGSTPGSMPPFSTSLEEEGVLFRAQYLVEHGRLLREQIETQLAAGRYPARHPAMNLADLQAQLAANQSGANLLRATATEWGYEVVDAYAGHVQRDARDAVAKVLATWAARRSEGPSDGTSSVSTSTFSDALDDGTAIVVELTYAEGRLRVDFGRSGAEHGGNLNAPEAVLSAALLYVLRCMVGRPIPLNAGCLDAVDLIVPSPSVLSPSPGRAVAGGNVETAQRIVDVLLGALGIAAASQGTMNNVTFGDHEYGHYETLGGGSGATANGPGAHAVHVHMTNTRITDLEVIESRFPVRLVRFARRKGSGGRGRHDGGDGLEREYEVQRALVFSLLSERRERAPFGLEGGGDGCTGAAFVKRHGAENWEPLPGKFTIELQPGDRVLVETPGGGAWGRRPNSTD